MGFRTAQSRQSKYLSNDSRDDPDHWSLLEEADCNEMVSSVSNVGLIKEIYKVHSGALFCRFPGKARLVI